MTTKTKPKRLFEYTVFVLLLGTGLAVAQLAFEGNSIDGVQVIAGKNSSTGKTLVPKVDPATGGLVVSGTITASTTGLATSAKQDTGNTSLSSIDTKLGNLQCIAPAASTKAAYSAVSGSSTTVDAGCTGNVALYVKATNLSRSYDLKFTGPDGGEGRIPPSGTEFFCKAGSATADSLTFDATCDTCNAGRVSVTAGCVN